MMYPFLPVRRNGKLLFPCGTFTGTYNHHELRFAVSLGYRIHDVEEQLIYTETWRPFDTWVDDLYERRLALQKIGSKQESVIKNLLVSIYGKFAQQAVTDAKFIEKDDFSVEDLKTYDTHDILHDDVVVCERESGYDPVFSFPILSSYITGYARILMYDYIVRGEALYTDTDSIITFKPLEDVTTIGRMKLEQTITDGVVVRPKLYRVDDHVRSKGFRRLDKEGFEKILHGEPISIVRWAKLRESLRRDLVVLQDLEVLKKASLEDDKRVWKTLFNEHELQKSEPLVLNEW